MLDEFNTYMMGQIERGIEVLLRGGIVAFPTDTVYGLGAYSKFPQSVERVYDLKGRSRKMALPLLLSNIAQIAEVASFVPAVAWLLAERFMPGALTLVLAKANSISHVITGGDKTIAVRVPKHPVPLALALGVSGPITGTSANLSGRPSALTAAEVRLQLGDRIDMVIDGGTCLGGCSSTIVDVTGDVPMIIRQGAISIDELKMVCNIIKQRKESR